MAPPPMAASVKIMGFAFIPPSLSVHTGTRVTFTNRDAATHTVTADGGLFSSGNLAPGQSFSFTFMGSEDPQATERLGTIGRMHSVIAALLTEIEEGGMAAPPWPPFRAPTLGVPQLTVPLLLDILHELPQPRREPADGEAGRVLDTEIEAQVHGPIDLHRDVELLIADPAFAATTTGAVLRELAHRYEIALRWHCGFWLPVRDVPDDFRGPEMPRLAQRIAGKDGTLDAAVIGSAAGSMHEQPEAWRDWGRHAEELQHLKQLWHVLVHYRSSIRVLAGADREPTTVLEQAGCSDDPVGP